MKELIKRTKKKFLRTRYEFSVSDLKEATPEEVYELFIDMADNRWDITESNRLVIERYIQSQMSPVGKETATKLKKISTFTTDLIVPSTEESIKRLDRGRFMILFIVYSISDTTLREGVKKIIEELHPSQISNLFIYAGKISNPEKYAEICNEHPYAREF